MKIIFGIIASENENQEHFKKFKEFWITNIKYTKQNPQLESIFDFYFLYTDPNKTSMEIKYKNGPVIYYDFYDNVIETNTINLRQDRIITKSLYNRTISFANYLNDLFKMENPVNYSKYASNGLFFIRTNLSTAFDFKLLYNWIIDKPKTNFFGGTFIGGFNQEKTIMSGTNLIMSFDIMSYLSNYKNTEIMDKYSILEDQLISTIIIRNLINHIFIINIKRLDFVEIEEVVLETHIWPATPPSILYHHCEKGDTDIFCFRFKTFERKNDVFLMNIVINEINKENYDINNLVKYLTSCTNLRISEEFPEYGTQYSIYPFKIKFASQITI